jgi:hypothetical protein
MRLLRFRRILLTSCIGNFGNAQFYNWIPKSFIALALDRLAAEPIQNCPLVFGLTFWRIALSRTLFLSQFRLCLPSMLAGSNRLENISFVSIGMEAGRIWRNA